jgi:hypothetical protein
MPLAPGQLDDVDGPVGDVLLQDALVPLQMEGGDWNEGLEMRINFTELHFDQKITEQITVQNTVQL